jgi:hypothetical protein
MLQSLQFRKWSIGVRFQIGINHANPKIMYAKNDANLGTTDFRLNSLK